MKRRQLYYVLVSVSMALWIHHSERLKSHSLYRCMKIAETSYLMYLFAMSNSNSSEDLDHLSFWDWGLSPSELMLRVPYV
jgi:hypothetical protein